MGDQMIKYQYRNWKRETHNLFFPCSRSCSKSFANMSFIQHFGHQWWWPIPYAVNAPWSPLLVKMWVQINWILNVATWWCVCWYVVFESPIYHHMRMCIVLFGVQQTKRIRSNGRSYFSSLLYFIFTTCVFVCVCGFVSPRCPDTQSGKALCIPSIHITYSIIISFFYADAQRLNIFCKLVSDFSLPIIQSAFSFR